MNGPKKMPKIIYGLEKNNDVNEESIEDYQVIKEDYCSSPKCGIKSKTVTKSVEKIIFSPLEISTNPYFKYYVTPVKEERFKYDFSQSETNHTRNHDEDKSKKSVNNINNQKCSYIELIKDELKEENNENESDTDNEGKNKNNTQTMKYKESGLTLESKNTNNINQTPKLKNNKINLHKTSTFSDNNHNITHSIKLKEKIKFSPNEKKENNDAKQKLKNSQKVMHNIFTLHDENKNKNNINNNNNDKNYTKAKTNSNFISNKSKRDNIKNMKSKVSPFNLHKDKKEPIRVTSSLTSTNINKIIKKKKRSQDEAKKVRTTNNLYNEQGKNSINRSIKEKLKRLKTIKDKDKDKEKDISIDSKRMKLEENKDNEDNKNIIKPKKKKSRHKKMKSLGEKVLVNIKKEINKCRNENDEKNKEKEKEKEKKKDESAKIRKNNFINYKININENMKKNSNLLEMPNSSKRRRRSIFDLNLEENKKKNILLNIRKEKEKEKENLTSKKKSAFSNKIVIDDREKHKEKFKEKNKNKDKNKDKENENEDKMEKKEKKKYKKKEKNKQKEKEKEKDKEKEMDINPKMIKRESKEKNRSNKNNTKQYIQKIERKKKCNTFYYHGEKPILKRESAKKLSIYPTLTMSNRSNYKNTVAHLQRMGSRELTMKGNFHLNQNSSKKLQPYVRRNSTRILFHDKSQNEKIIALTNKQTIDNINEYTRQCLEIIPDLYELDEMPRCKNKIHPEFLKNNSKKIALFDLDETLVHCLGEINMNNVENFSRQCDAKIKVQLPGGKQITIGINIRPHWEQALDIIKDKYHIIAYTASHESYADSVLNFLDPDKKYFEYRLYRSHCVLCVVDEMKFYVKDLGILDECCNIKDVVLIDNSVLSFAYHLDNGIPISPFYDSKIDYELLDISNFLLKYASENDIRNKLREIYKLNDYLEIIKNYNSEESFTGSSDISVVQEDLEGERTHKNGMNKNNNNKYNFSLNIKNSNKNNNNYMNNNKSIAEENNTSKSKMKEKTKNSSQCNLKFKEIIKFFDKNGENEKKSKSFSRASDSKKIDEFMNMNRNIDSMCVAKKKNKYRSFRYFDFNFKKEWDEKQKELNEK